MSTFQVGDGQAGGGQPGDVSTFQSGDVSTGQADDVVRLTMSG